MCKCKTDKNGSQMLTWQRFNYQASILWVQIFFHSSEVLPHTIRIVAVEMSWLQRDDGGHQQYLTSVSNMCLFLCCSVDLY